MSDKRFQTEIWIRAWIDQMTGYPVGSLQRVKTFEPIVMALDNPDGSVDREGTLDGPFFGVFAPEERAVLLDRSAT